MVIIFGSHGPSIKMLGHTCAPNSVETYTIASDLARLPSILPRRFLYGGFRALLDVYCQQ